MPSRASQLTASASSVSCTAAALAATSYATASGVSTAIAAAK
tara:strand:+ start:2394 stop:2519 length:126 start_codon:yes stop_codon:yes gene_type:complete